MSNDRVEQYRVNATKCIGLVQKASDIHTKLTLLEMARGWLLLADQALKNGNTAAVYEPSMRSLTELGRGSTEDGH
jgi:hypothetical protein